MKVLCDIVRKPLTLEQALTLRGWLVYDGAYKDFCSNPRFYNGQLIPVSKAVEAERLVNVITNTPSHG
jgi:hypothetical protein